MHVYIITLIFPYVMIICFIDIPEAVVRAWQVPGSGRTLKCAICNNYTSRDSFVNMEIHLHRVHQRKGHCLFRGICTCTERNMCYVDGWTQLFDINHLYYHNWHYVYYPYIHITVSGKRVKSRWWYQRERQNHAQFTSRLKKGINLLPSPIKRYVSMFQ